MFFIKILKKKNFKLYKKDAFLKWLYSKIMVKSLRKNFKPKTSYSFTRWGTRILNFNLFSYIIFIRNKKKNTILSITDIKGKPTFFASSGMVGLKGRQKKKYPQAYNLLIKKFLLNFKLPFDEKFFAVNLRNIPKYFNNLILRLFAKVFYIKSLKISNRLPYNGCRPRKFKRKKRRRRRLVRIFPAYAGKSKKFYIPESTKNDFV